MSGEAEATQASFINRLFLEYLEAGTRGTTSAEIAEDLIFQHGEGLITVNDVEMLADRLQL